MKKGLPLTNHITPSSTTHRYQSELAQRHHLDQALSEAKTLLAERDHVIEQQRMSLVEMETVHDCSAREKTSLSTSVGEYHDIV